MAPGKMRLGQSLADQLADLEDPTPKGRLNRVLLTFARRRGHPIADLVPDFDPEDLDRDGDSSDEGAGKEPDLNAGREHYQSVGWVVSLLAGN